MERPSTFWWRKSRCSCAAQHFLFGDRVKRRRVGGCFKRKPAKKQHSKQLNKYSGKGNQQEQRHTLHGFGWARRLAEGEMPCGLVELSEFEVNWLSVLHCCYAAFKVQMMRRMTMMRTRFLDLLKAARVFAMQMCC